MTDQINGSPSKSPYLTKVDTSKQVPVELDLNGNGDQQLLKKEAFIKKMEVQDILAQDVLMTERPAILQPSNIITGLTFNDILMIPQYSQVDSRSQVSLKTKFSRNVTLNQPFVSSPMDTVTESEMAIEMARNGGIGIIHRFMSIEEQVEQISIVKNSGAHVIVQPYSFLKTNKVKDLLQAQKNLQMNTFMIVDKKIHSIDDKSPGAHRIKRSRSDQKNREVLCGIVTNRDLRFAKNPEMTVEQIMIPLEKMVVKVIADPTQESQFPQPEEVKETMVKHRIEKLPLVTSKNEILGLIFLKDILRLKERPQANLDAMGQLRVGAAVGGKDDYIQRAGALIEANVDVLVVDVANGHSQLCIDTVKTLKQKFPKTDVVAGSIATGEGALKLIEAGADGIRCGIGNGSICITRVVAGAGIPQLSALMSVAPICKKFNIPLISDGGNGNSGNMCKALAMGASCIMLGRLVAGSEESPSKAFYRDGKLVKIYRGMAGYGSNVAKAQRTGQQEPGSNNFTPEGVEGVIPFAGPLRDVLFQFGTGIKSGMSYCGAFNMKELQENAKFIRITGSGIKESGVHDISKIV